MDKQQRITPTDHAPGLSSCPGRLWIGDPEYLANKAHRWMQERWCQNKGCRRCTICTLIEQHQYYKALWLAPEKGHYPTAILEPLFQTLNQLLDPGAEMIFVLQQADTLPSTCYNSLLKSLEEPPAGYHFILMAQRLHDVAPTIRSRCIIIRDDQGSSPAQHPLAQFFTSVTYCDPTEFSQVLDATNPHEQEVLI